MLIPRALSSLGEDRARPSVTSQMEKRGLPWSGDITGAKDQPALTLLPALSTGLVSARRGSQELGPPRCPSPGPECSQVQKMMGETWGQIWGEGTPPQAETEREA